MPSYKMRMAGKKSAEIYIYDFIGNFFGDGITADRFAKDLKALGQVDELNVRLNSPGGDVADGIAIYNVLQRHPALINVDIDADALSIASVIAMAASPGRLRMAKNARMMIHKPFGGVMGNADDLRRRADVMDMAEESIIRTYADRSKMDSDVIRQMISEETWMSADDAVKYGFADSITEELKMVAHADFSMFGYKKAPSVNNDDLPKPNLYRAKIAAMNRV